MKRVRCYRCGYLDKPEWFTPFKLAHKGHTRRVYLCDACVGYCVTNTLKHVLTKKEEKELHIRILNDRRVKEEPIGIIAIGGKGRKA